MPRLASACLPLTLILGFFATTATADPLPEPPVGVATPATRAANVAVAERLPLTDPRDFEDASRGLVAQLDDPRILNPDGSTAWDTARFEFLDAPAPATVNPSLWRQSQLNSLHGLFEVVPGSIWQFRGYDLAVMTLIAGDSGWIVVDPLTSAAPVRAGLALANRELGERPVTGIIYTHSHGDHFGGVRGLLDEAEVAARDVQVIAPHGFTAEAVSENLMAGNYMSRRAALQFGTHLPAGATGHVGTGLGQRLSTGQIGLLRPTHEVPLGGETLTIDGVEFVFVDASHTEAPAELMFYLPALKALCTAEVATRTFHNVLTPRGAKVRDTLRWSQVLDQVLVRFGGEAEVMFASHHWPTWGRERLQQALQNQRDLYRYVHDQTIRLANHGGTQHEIAEQLAEPHFAATDFGTRGYYGTLNHNSKAVYQNYFGWWDGVPANYHPHPPEAAATRYVELMGGAEEGLRKGIDAFESGDYRWAATVFNHLVFADAGNRPAQEWLAAAYEQMGFQAESGAWRNYYLTAAMELRDGLPETPLSFDDPDFLQGVPTAALLDALVARYDPARLGREPFVIQFVFPDRQEQFHVEINPAVAFPRSGMASTPTAQLTLDRGDFDRLLLRRVELPELLQGGRAELVGDGTAIGAFFAALDQFEYWFNVVTP
tara:strand:- start:22608 stop:24584 length:1977 start_codon:yes stop_codon:yes gene_type:complete